MISFSEAKAAARRKKRTSERIMVIELVLRDVEPRIWRRLVVRESMWMSRLHDAIQVAFGWFDYHLHRFNVHGVFYGNPIRRESETMVEDDRDIALMDLGLGPKDVFLYEYLFGDGWQVQLRIEKVEHMVKGMKLPALVAGGRNGAPEDCGGPAGFKEVLYSISHPDEPLSKEWLEWLGPGYDPSELDIAKINKALAKLPK
jgi:hypothetical protein